MDKKKNTKVPYQEYQILKEKANKQRFKLKLYPWPVLCAILLPPAVFILMTIYYLLKVRQFSG